MSRGPGRIQRFIVEKISAPADRDGRLYPVPFLAWCYADRPEGATPALRSAFRRAADQLQRSGVVAGYHATLPTAVDLDARPGTYRRVQCIALPGIELGDEDVQGAGARMLSAIPMTPGYLRLLMSMKQSSR